MTCQRNASGCFFIHFPVLLWLVPEIDHSTGKHQALNSQRSSHLTGARLIYAQSWKSSLIQIKWSSAFVTTVFSLYTLGAMSPTFTPTLSPGPLQRGAALASWWKGINSPCLTVATWNRVSGMFLPGFLCLGKQASGGHFSICWNTSADHLFFSLFTRLARGQVL